MADNDDVASVAAAMAQFAGPCLALQQLLVERVQRLRKLRAQQFVGIPADSLGGGEAVKPLHAARPETDFAAKFARHHLRQTEPGRLRLQRAKPPPQRFDLLIAFGRCAHEANG